MKIGNFYVSVFPPGVPAIPVMFDDLYGSHDAHIVTTGGIPIFVKDRIAAQRRVINSIQDSSNDIAKKKKRKMNDAS